MQAIDQLVTAAINHALGGQSWAAERLRPYAGAQVAVLAGRFSLRLGIDGQGAFQPGDFGAAANVTIELPDDAPARLLTDRAGLLAAARLSGSADLAESLAFVFRNLEWDVEADLARVVGDIAARRLTRFGGGLLDGLREAFRRTAQNVAEYATEEAPLLTPRRDIAAFCAAVDTLRDDVARLEKRIARL